MGQLEALTEQMRALGILELEMDGERIRRIRLSPDWDAPTPAPDEPDFGLPEALQRAKDDEAQAMRDEADAKWQDEQERFAASEGYEMESP